MDFIKTTSDALKGTDINKREWIHSFPSTVWWNTSTRTVGIPEFPSFWGTVNFPGKCMQNSRSPNTQMLPSICLNSSIPEITCNIQYPIKIRSEALKVLLKPENVTTSITLAVQDVLQMYGLDFNPVQLVTHLCLFQASYQFAEGHWSPFQNIFSSAKPNADCFAKRWSWH